MSAGSALGGWLEGAFDSPDPADPAYVDPSLYDPSAYYSISESAKNKAAAAANRVGPKANWAQDDQSRGLVLDSRGRQMATADDMEAFLRGERMSLAEKQAQENLARVQAQQANLAANVRGGAGNQLAAASMAQRQGLAAGIEAKRQGDMLRAQEEMGVRSQLAQLYGQARGQDLALRQGDQGRATFDVTAAQQNQAQNDAQQRFFEELRLKGVQGASQAQQAYGAAQQGAQQSVQGLNAQREQAAADRNAAVTGSLMQAGAQYAALGMQGGGQPAPTGAPAPAPPQPKPAPVVIEGSSTPGQQGGSTTVVDPWAGTSSGGSSDLIDPWDPRRRKF